MNIKIIAALSVGLFATQVSALEISAIDKKNSAFVGAYGQIGTGYESNTAQSGTITTLHSGDTSNWNTPQNPTSDGVALVLGGGYNFQLHPKVLLGVGGDWSAFNNVTDDADYTSSDGDSAEIAYKTSNRYSIFVTPSYVIDKDKLAYFKVGYTGQGVTLVNYGEGNSTMGGSAQLSGYALGLGYKQMITHGVYAFGEGNYYGYSKSNWNATQAESQVNVNANPDVISYTFLAGVGYVYVNSMLKIFNRPRLIERPLFIGGFFAFYLVTSWDAIYELLYEYGI